MTAVPLDVCGVVTFSQVPLLPRALHPNTHPKVTAVFVLWAVQPCGGV